MNTLAIQQEALLAALWLPANDGASRTLAQWLEPAPAAAQALSARGLQAYRSNAGELARRALGAAFPVLLQLLSEENFGHLAHDFWSRQPPVRGDIAQWGGALAAHIETLPQLLDEPYLADVARAEWALHVLATAPDSHAEASSFALLAQLDPAVLTLKLAPAICVASTFPVASIVLAHLQDEPTLAQAGQRLRDGAGETALAWRRGLKPMLRAAMPGEAAFVGALQESASLLDSLAAAPELDFDSWLKLSVQSGLLLGVVPL